MATMNLKLYAALIDAGASEDKARDAAAGAAVGMDDVSVQLYFLQGIGVLTLVCIGWITLCLIGQ